MSTLDILNELHIAEVEVLHDYLQIVFSKGVQLSVFNSYHYDGDSIVLVTAKQVQSVNEGESSIRIMLEDGSCLRIGMNDNDYNGPEAIVLKREGEPTMVWS